MDSVYILGFAAVDHVLTDDRAEVEFGCFAFFFINQMTVLGRNYFGAVLDFIDGAGGCCWVEYHHVEFTNGEMKGEYFLPAVVSQLLAEKKARVRVLSSEDKWYGVTYKEDKPVVVAALASMREKGLYPKKLWA